MKTRLTRAGALAKLKESRTLTTAMLEPLGIKFESFLKLAQLPKAQADAIVEAYIKHLDGAPLAECVRDVKEGR